MLKKYLALAIFSLSLGAYLLSLSACGKHPYTQGKIMYENFCENCHMADGSGLKGLIPPIAGSDYLKEKRAHIACVIKYGQSEEINVNGKTYEGVMPPNPQLSAVEITNIINYINNSWGNSLGQTSIKEVEKNLSACKTPKPQIKE